jgi:hypothetical protein
MGEVYLGVLNGPGYTSGEVDRFKDYTARVTLNPLASSEAGVLKSLALVGYYYKGETASNISTEGLKRDRWGTLVGIKDARFSLAGEYNQNTGGRDSLAGLPPVRGTTDSTGRLFSFYGTAKPFKFFDSQSTIPLGIVLRWDDVKADKDVDAKYHVFIGGLTFEINKKVSFALDYQEQIPHSGASVSGGTQKTYFAHWVANF